MKLNEDAKPEHFFILANGHQIKNIQELSDALKNADNWVFEHHVTAERNDFSNWIKDIYLDGELASDIKKAKNKKSAVRIFNKALKRNFKKKRLEEKEQQKKEKNSRKINPPKKRKDILNLLRENK